MRVLHLPVNIASQISVTVRALRDIGVDAQGLALGNAIVQDQTGVRSIAFVPRQERLRWAASKIHLYALVLSAIARSDVIHWHYAQPALRGAIDLKWAHRLKKPAVVEFWGSDIRIPELEASDNPYYKQVMAAQEYRHVESFEGSRLRQKRFASYQIAALTSCQSMFRYVQRDLFPTIHFVRQRVYLPDYTPSFPDPSNACPLLLHSPTAPIAKGTPAVTAAIEQLRSTHAFRFQLVQGMPYEQARQLLRSCDILVDQFVIGAHGLAALEAMAFGKPVVCYIKPSMVEQYPPDLPIVRATQESLPDVLARLIEDGRLRHELGQRGRAYVEKYHDAHLLARQLVEIYQRL